MNTDNYLKFIAVSEMIDKLAASSIDPKTKYDAVFDLAGRIKETGIQFDWADPDTSYEEDVRAYASAVHEKARHLLGVLKTLEAKCA